MPQIESDINLQDLFQIKKLIEVVSTRGAIQAHEMETVGKLYNKLDKILEKQLESNANASNSPSP